MLANKNRPSWREYFLKLAEIVKGRSNCLRMSVGVVIVKDKHIISTGYNGTPAGITNCIDGGCKRCKQRHSGELKENERKDLCICIHAEQNALLQTAYHGISTKGAIMYSTTAPCLQCAKHIINAGIAKVIFTDNHQDRLGIDLLQKAGIDIEKAR
ncbi:hypothetical protein A2866_04880 [Candidatus Roizmanbacteria bacterium RIFCSPHIGHO2_01_FULL_39_8]|uniref:CMP/dCMP-type deaminase domain-containing protein n=2 Tax=Candidatus Roizmaniibacteriota TaxID=1752723 RepID=A0A1F7GPY3_9BACT|nr:MAG: hypothetical protein A2866_04880 [Candidatus Roizmanbacteria bacterium RIFCSPHIGHO2_01_FULL_39_8]OGK36078.1 MAG: hypothetical protein A3F60_00410 [Candidatus Roizmanbacteria bacterium RIFCSPHIGHO2_12_FULL_39_8]